jgi:RNA polymerase-interacting CarD/CdnL/TRCF family regulator
MRGMMRGYLDQKSSGRKETIVDSNITYSTGDWVVHLHYGVGQINRIETKPILGEDIKCFKVMTKDSTYWFPTTDTDNPRIRPVASEEIIKKVIKNLRRKANKLDTDRKQWKDRIDEVLADGDLLSISNLVRDLSTQQVLRPLNQTEDNALKHFEDRLLREWASIVGEEVDLIRPKYHAYIQESKAKIEVTEK